MHIDRVIFLSNFFLGKFSHLEIIDKPYIIYAFFLGIFFYSQIIDVPIYFLEIFPPLIIINAIIYLYFSQKIFYNIENNVWLIYL